MVQKYFKGDLVRLGEMPDYMRHFPSNCKAIVLYTYKEKYGGHGQNADKDYCLYLLKKGCGEVSWYHESQLTFIEADRFDLLPKSHVDRKVWEAKRKRETASMLARIKGETK